MATVDFTLEDIAEQTERIVLAARLQERGHTRQIVRDEVGEQVQQSERRIIGQFLSFIEHNFEPAIDSLQTQIGEVKAELSEFKIETKTGISELKSDMAQVKRNAADSRAIVNKHSKDIMELRARRA